DPPIARPHRSEMEKAEGRSVDALGDPAQHATAMAVDPVPHDLTDEPTDLAKARSPLELRHPHGHLVAADLGNERAGSRVHEVGLAGSSAEAGRRLHALGQELEIARGQIEIHVELAEVVEVVERDRLQSCVERLDDSRAHATPSPIGALHNPEVWQP